jgi:hypothetical protein
LDVPAFALSSKVVFSTSNTGLTADVIWFNQGAPGSTSNPILSIFSSGWIDYIKNYTKNASSATPIASGDFILFQDVSGADDIKKTLVSGITALAVPAAGSITPAQLSQPFTIGTSVSTTSGTAIDFTSIPSWVKRITVMFREVSTNGTSPFEIRIGSGSVANTGYASGAFTPNTLNTGSTTGFIITAANYASAAYAGSVTLLLESPSSYRWVSSGVISATVSVSSNGGGNSSGGSKTLSGVLDRIRITTTGGANTFSGGSVNILYE